MKRLAILIIPIALGLLAAPSQDVAAQSERTTKPVNLVGEWKMEKSEVEMAGDQRWDHETFEGGFTITKQTGAIVNAKSYFKLNAGRGHDGKMHVTEREVDLVGVLSWSGDEITLVSHGEKDGWVFNGKIVNPDMIEFVAYETGEHGWAARYLALRR